MPEFLTLIEELNELTEKFIDQHKLIGNDCAYTDSIVEEILDVADKIRAEYDKI